MEEFHRQKAKTELYLLIAKFLENSPCERTLQVLKEELANNEIVPKRLDWEGDSHELSVDEWLGRYRHISGNFLLDLSLRVGPLVDKELTPTCPGIKTLLGSGNQSLLRTSINGPRKKWRLTDYSVRRNHCHLYSSNSCLQHNLVNILFGREVSGPPCKNQVLNTNLFKRVHLLGRTLGHLSAVYCVLFDKTGKYIITGADDFLVKIWSAIDGRLLKSLRGSSSEITDIAINLKNTLICAGSLDKLIRVWCLQNGFPVGVLSAHTGVITGVYFCPLNLNNSYYLVSTSSDGSVAFWNYTEEQDSGQYTFPSRPVLYNEKIRPGQAQIICGSFSMGGMFLAAGSADHHVRVYSMEGDVPHRIMEMEKHSERVDSIQWAHRSFKFISGSKDGTAIIWQYKAQHWSTIQLNMATLLDNRVGDGKKGVEQSSSGSVNKLKATMVCWNSDDSVVVTAVNDYSLKVWDPNTGKLIHVINNHKDEAYVVESHPFNPRLMFTAGHDGICFFWDIISGKQLLMFENHIEGQGNGAVFDARWSPDGTMVAATDSHGHIILFGLAHYSKSMQQLPGELFFHTDYRPLTRGSDGMVVDSQTQIPPHLMPPPFLVDIDGNPYPPQIQKLVPGRQFCTSDQLIPNVVFTDGGGQEVIEGVENSDDGWTPRQNNSNNYANVSTSPRSRMRRSGSVEGIRHSIGNWQRDDNEFFWTQSVIVPPLSSQAVVAAEKAMKNLSLVEVDEYNREKLRPPEINETVDDKKPTVVKKKRTHAYRTRANYDHLGPHQEEGESSSGEKETSDVTARSEDMSSSSSGGSSSSDEQSSEYSDWVADHGVSLEPPQRSRRKRKKPPPPPSAPAPPQQQPVSKKKPIAPQPSTSQSNLNIKALSPNELMEVYKPSEWLSEVIPKKFPYYPQMGDEVMFFKRGYQLYLSAVREKNVYRLTPAQITPWGNFNIQEPALVKVIGIKYEMRPPRLCCLRLAVIGPNQKLTNDRFNIKYHDIPDVIDFLVLKHTYDTAINRKWKPGDRFRSMIDDCWWWGVIEDRKDDIDSDFLCHRIKWDNGEEEDMSPWDMEPIDNDREPENGGSLPVLPEEINALLYRPRAEEWPGGDRDSACNRILAGLAQIMSLAIAEPFNAPVDINTYPTYAQIVEYPVDLSLIKARLENRFYRRLTAAQFDVRYLATNAEKFNEPHSVIVKEARIITDLCLTVMKEECFIEVPQIYRQLMDAYQSSVSEESDIDEPSTSRRQRAAANRFLRAMRRANRDGSDSHWSNDCFQLLELLWNSKDSQPFRKPKNPFEDPNYGKMIDNPVDLLTIREELKGGNYKSPIEFCNDIRKMINNSKENTSKKSKVYVMTVRLAAMAEEQMNRIIYNYRYRIRKGKRSLNPTSRQANQRKRKTNYSTGEDDSCDEDFSVKKSSKGKRLTKGRVRVTNQVSSSESSSSADDNNSNNTSSSQDERGKSGDEKSIESDLTNINGWDQQPSTSRNKGESSSCRSQSNEDSKSCEDAKSIPNNNWSLNEKGTVRILRPLRPGKATVPPEVLQVSREVILEDGDDDNSSDESSDGNGEATSKSGKYSSSEDEESSEDESLDTVVNNDTTSSSYKTSSGIIKINVENNSSSSSSRLSQNGELTGMEGEEDLIVEPIRIRVPVKRPRPAVVTSSESGGDSFQPSTSSSSKANARPKRAIKKKRSYFDEDSDCYQEEKASKGRTNRRSQRKSDRKQYKEDSSDTDKQPELSISLHGRIRKLRPQVRALLKDS